MDPPRCGQTAFCLFRYENCEMRTVIISDTSGESGGLDPLFFPGGHSIKEPGNEPVQAIRDLQSKPQNIMNNRMRSMAGKRLGFKY